MMFRMIKIDERDIDLQRIVWRRPGEKSITHFQLLTVTYGTASAPFLAGRVIKELAAKGKSQFPKAAKILAEDTYVDDICSGADSEEDAITLRNEIISLLSSGDFPLRKWSSNNPKILEGLTSEERLRPEWINFQKDGPISTLGVSWDASSDTFRFKSPVMTEVVQPTKRLALSYIARLFDPVGWLAPVTIIAKVFMQDLWKYKIGWDDKLPTNLQHSWDKFIKMLPEVKNLTLPRWINMTPTSELELHAFGDASKKAYAAVVYARVINNKEIKTWLIAAKTRVAPIKTQSIPRLELCASLLASKLLVQVQEDLQVKKASLFAWTDSTAVLGWINDPDPGRWPVFIANRVSEIQYLLPNLHWKYINTKENPADIASRGLIPQHLQNNDLWWQGPVWLKLNKACWPVNPSKMNFQTPETPLLVKTCYISTQISIVDRFSTLEKMQRVIALCLRFSKKSSDKVKNSGEKFRSPSVSELNFSFNRCVWESQHNSFLEEIESLKKGITIKRTSQLLRLSPFLDSEGILRVGGRLGNSKLPYNEKHPMILSGKSSLSRLIIDWAHRMALHGGFKVTYGFVMRRVWLIGGTRLIKSHVHNCVTCAKVRAQTLNQRMADLPPDRVIPSPAFSVTGLDYAGPILLHQAKGRGAKTYKGYIALFVCLSTKAINLELVGDLSTESFIGALYRFTGRRGKPRKIWSDNATTFQGADTELKGLMRDLKPAWEAGSQFLATQGIEWAFIPPKAPHFGGLWEAGVKSAKLHIKKVLGSRILTYEELNTFLIRVEAVLNCRPLTPLSGEIEDLEVLTPGHFLRGAPLNQLPFQANENIKIDHLAHWELVKALFEQFWSRWSREYLHTLQQRAKWNTTTSNLKRDEVVMIIDPALIQNDKWPLGRVICTFPGQDGLVRAAKIRTAFGVYERPIVKLCRLPVSESDRLGNEAGWDVQVTQREKKY